MTSTTVVWRGLDAPRMEIARVEGGRARGTQIGVAYELRYDVAPGLLQVEVVGGEAALIELGDADFFDLGFSPLFNSFPIWSGLDRARDFRMRFVEVPSLAVSESPQRYEPLEPGRVRFRSGDFGAEIEYDADGLVTTYEGLAVRLARV